MPQIFSYMSAKMYVQDNILDIIDGIYIDELDLPPRLFPVIPFGNQFALFQLIDIVPL